MKTTENKENIFVKKKGAGAWIARNGYYFLLVLSVAAIGVTAAVGLTGNDKTDTQLLNAVSPTPITVTPVPTELPINAEPTEAPTAVSSEEPVAAQPTAVPKKTSVFIDPVVNGESVGDFSMDMPVYSATLDQWATHNGVDFAAAEGSDVIAAADGTVLTVTHDVLMGNVIRISHADGLVTEYAGLADTKVKEGDKVSSGTVIGTVGQTAVRESALGAHLHFAVTSGGTYVDPLPYLPGGSK